MPSLQEIEGDDWGNSNPEDTRMVQRCKELRRKPIADFDDEDLRLMIGQQIGTDHLAPIAIAAVQANPLASGDMFEGALIENLVRIDDDWWAANPKEELRLRAVVDQIDWNDWNEDFEKSVRQKVESWINARLANGSESGRNGD